MLNPYSLEGKTILVTGASSGIGRATAILCSQLGATVMITARKTERLTETLGLLKRSGHHMFLADLTDENQLRDLVEKLPVIDGLVNNAGMLLMTPLQFIKSSKLQQVLNINTLAPILLTQYIVKAKKMKEGGSIVFTNSISGNRIGSVGNVLYSTSKAAIHGFVLNAALELAPKHIRVNEVQPGMIDTNLHDGSVITEEDLAEDIKKYPLGRHGKPEDVAAAIAYFLSEASSFCTGTSLVIDGGFTIQ